MLKINGWETNWCLFIVCISLFCTIKVVSKEEVTPFIFTIGTVAIILASFVIGYIASAKIILMQNVGSTKRIQRDTNDSIGKHIL